MDNREPILKPDELQMQQMLRPDRSTANKYLMDEYARLHARCVALEKVKDAAAKYIHYCNNPHGWSKLNDALAELRKGGEE